LPLLIDLPTYLPHVLESSHKSGQINKSDRNLVQSRLPEQNERTKLYSSPRFYPLSFFFIRNLYTQGFVINGNESVLPYRVINEKYGPHPTPQYHDSHTRHPPTYIIIESDYIFKEYYITSLDKIH
jgi:hypothetical protein